ncbi:Nramp family divalent metal transporter [Sphingomonas morindae]|uniref:Divalent metal cation transporter MntH n=1 Tax=Sphingomonas morindae TaxID=1541170 RepID=A0ABY4X958_9SPHN|nr:Nramp family divalent metal transporter [Sphingomonas morindae]USI73434.1 Nramp family divalent metal transporter [Sphingomonas morindae]
MHGTFPLQPGAACAAAPARASLAEAHRTVPVPRGPGGFWKKLAAFSGPGYLVAVGYMDPGNWATDLAGGAAFGYALLSAVLLSSLMAMLLQALSARLGIVTGLDLAQACAQRYPRPVRLGLWLLCELAIIACDCAELLGTAIALQLLFGLPLPLGIGLTLVDVVLMLALQKRGFRALEAFILALMGVIAACFALELLLARPAPAAILAGLVPQAGLVRDPGQLYLAIGILGATVMPHNLYLHSALVQTRRFARDEPGRRAAITLATIDSSVALTLAALVNAAILILAAAAFHAGGHAGVTEIGQAYHLLTPLLGASAAGLAFAVALLAAGQNATVTGTLAGQIVMEGFTGLAVPAWARRLVTRALAIVPAAVIASLAGGGGATRLLILTQVVLSLQLPFAVVPLVRITADPAVMGRFAVRGWLKASAWLVATAVIALNLVLLASLA